MDSVTAFQTLQDTVVTNAASQLLDWLVVPSIVITLVIVIVFAVRSFYRYRVNQAIFEIRDILRDMQDKDSTLSEKSPPKRKS